MQATINRHQIVGQALVIDRDTIEIHGRRVRFHGLDWTKSWRAFA
jgi:hypothetical protein